MRRSIHSLARIAVSVLVWGGAVELLSGCASTTPKLSTAAENGQVDVAKDLLNDGADPNQRDRYDYTPLHWAAYEGQVDVAKLLLDHGADINALEYTKSTPLALAVDRGYVDMVKLLLDKGANPNTADKDGWTPLHYAVRNGNSEIVIALLEHHADIHARTGDTHQTPLELAHVNNRPEVAAILKDHGAE